MTFYKVTRPDGGSFHDPTVVYEVGKRVRPKPHTGKRRLCGQGVLHASPTAAQAMRYGQWPCKVFEVEGKPFLEEDDKAGFKQLRVVREVEPWQAFGPNGREVQAVLDRIAVCTSDEVEELAAAWDAARAAARGAARDAAWGAVVADLIGQYGYTQKHHDLLTGPWRKVIGVWDGTEWVKEER